MDNNKRKIQYKPMKIDFNALSGDEFENMCYWLVDDMKEFSNTQQVGVQNTKAVDISAYKSNKLYYIQVKRYKSLTNQDIDKILSLMKEKIDEDGIVPYAFVIMTSSEVGEKRRLYFNKKAKELGLNGIKQFDIWDGNKIEKLLYKHKKVMDHFYKDGSTIKIKRSPFVPVIMTFSIIIILFVSSLVAGLLFPNIPLLPEFSKLIFGRVGQDSGYIQEFAKDLDELIIVLNTESYIDKQDTPAEVTETLKEANRKLISGNSEEAETLIKSIKPDELRKSLPPADFITGTAKFLENEKKSDITSIYKNSIEKVDDFWQLFNNYGVVQYHLGEINTALDYFEKARQVINNSPEVLRNLSIAYNRLGYANKAVATLLKAQETLSNTESSSGKIITNKEINTTKFNNISKTSLKNDILRNKKEYLEKIKNPEELNKELKRITIQDPRLLFELKKDMEKLQELKLKEGKGYE